MFFVYNKTGKFFITQPGSTIITSLCQSEAKDKYCGIMEVKNDTVRLIPIQLKTIRPYIFDEIVLSDHFETDIELQSIDDYLVDKVQAMIEKAEHDHPAPSQQEAQHLSFITNYTEMNEEKGDISRLPLVRLRVDYTDFPKIRASQFGQHFHGKVANPDDILLLHKRTGDRKKQKEEDEKEQQSRTVRGGNLFNFSTGIQQTEPIEDIVSKNITVKS